MGTRRKSQVACEFCCEQVAAPHLWTFTVPCGTPDEVFKNGMNRFLDDGVKWWGVRVWERQKNGTLHCHAVVAGRHAVHVIRPISQHYLGFFSRVNVVRIKGDQGVRYVAKYLRKQDRSMKGMRRWQCFGKWPVERSKVQNIVNHSRISDAYRSVTTDELALWKPEACERQVMRNFAKMEIARAKVMAAAGWLLFLRERRIYAGKEFDPFDVPLPGIEPFEEDRAMERVLGEKIPF